jgi:2'-5' RNA ligase
MRCFVAIDLPDDLKDTLALAQGALGDAAPQADVRWTPPGSMHVTLQFLGEVPAAEVPAVAGAVAGAASRCPPLALRAVGVGAFPSPARARVVFADVEGDADALRALVGDLGARLEPLGWPPEARAFHAHVTLGRVRRPRSLGRLATAIADVGRRARFGAWTATDVVLYHSRLGGRHGSTYEALARVPLSSPCP